MSFLAIIAAFFIEQYKVLSTPKKWFRHQITQYAGFFVNREFHTVREIRMQFLIALIPFVVITLFLYIMPLANWHIPYFIINASLFILSIDILGWKQEAKNSNKEREYVGFIQSFATNFFAATFWFILLPSVLGTICYLTLTAMGNLLRSRGEQSAVYIIVVDKMLFWINLVPYTVLIMFIAIAGDFEEVTHYVISQRNKVKVSFYYLESVLTEVAFLAIGKDKFAKASSRYQDDTIEDYRSNKDRLNPEIIKYVVALLYRVGVFFIGSIIIISLVELL
ncbi:MAG: hypothetical protein PHC75_02740 [Burkholderiales bacterium]|nr:hypothetical protein [Burkholderiales bacterium]